MKRLITIDGPAASGKSSVSRNVARNLGWKWVSTGAFYRGLSYVAHKEKVNPSDVSSLVKVCNSDMWSIQLAPEDTEVLYRGENVTQHIKDEVVGNYASQISHHPEVRKALLNGQRELASSEGLVAEGRDCGTVVFPQAPLKIFLTAREEARAERRAQEQGKNVEEVLKSQEKRDQQDSSRSVAPLQVAGDGFVIDTSELDLEGVVQRVLDLASERGIS